MVDRGEAAGIGDPWRNRRLVGLRAVAQAEPAGEVPVVMYRLDRAAFMRRAANEGWDTERKQESAAVSKAASAALGEERTAQLANFSADDLKIACAIRAKAEAHGPARSLEVFRRPEQTGGTNGGTKTNLQA